MIRHFLIYSLTIITVFIFVWTALLLMWMNIDAELTGQTIFTLSAR